MAGASTAGAASGPGSGWGSRLRPLRGPARPGLLGVEGGAGRGGVAAGICCEGRSGVGDDVSVEDLDSAGHTLGDGAVVGDDHDGRTALVKLVDQHHQGTDGALTLAPRRGGGLRVTVQLPTARSHAGA